MHEDSDGCSSPISDMVIEAPHFANANADQNSNRSRPTVTFQKMLGSSGPQDACLSTRGSQALCARDERLDICGGRDAIGTMSAGFRGTGAPLLEMPEAPNPIAKPRSHSTFGRLQIRTSVAILEEVTIWTVRFLSASMDHGESSPQSRRTARTAVAARAVSLAKSRRYGSAPPDAAGTLYFSARAFSSWT